MRVVVGRDDASLYYTPATLKDYVARVRYGVACIVRSALFGAVRAVGKRSA